MGRRPNISFEISTSLSDSFRWMWIPVPRSSASARASRRSSSEARGSHSMPTSTFTRPSAAPLLRPEGLLVVGERVEIVLIRRDVVREDRADADLLGRLGERAELAVHVVDGRDAALDRLAVARERGPVRRLRVERADHRVPAGLQVLPERQVIAPPFAEGGVVVEVDEPRHDDLVGGVEDSCAVSVRSLAGGDLRDPVVVDDDRPAEVHVVVVVQRDDDRVPDDDSLAHCSLPLVART